MGRLSGVELGPAAGVGLGGEPEGLGPLRDRQWIVVVDDRALDQLPEQLALGAKGLSAQTGADFTRGPALNALSAREHDGYTGADGSSLRPEKSGGCKNLAEADYLAVLGHSGLGLVSGLG